MNDLGVFGNEPIERDVALKKGGGGFGAVGGHVEKGNMYRGRRQMNGAPGAPIAAAAKAGAATNLPSSNRSQPMGSSTEPPLATTRQPAMRWASKGAMKPEWPADRPHELRRHRLLGRHR